MDTPTTSTRIARWLLTLLPLLFVLQPQPSKSCEPDSRSPCVLGSCWHQPKGEPTTTHAILSRSVCGERTSLPSARYGIRGISERQSQNNSAYPLLCRLTSLLQELLCQDRSKPRLLLGSLRNTRHTNE